MDSTYSYIHMADQRHVLFQDLWEHDTIPFDEVDLPESAYSVSVDARDNLLQDFLSNMDDPENDLTIISSNNPMFNSSLVHRLKQKKQNLNWKDLGLREFLGKKGYVPDHTILKRPRFGDPRVLEGTSLDDYDYVNDDVEAQSSFDAASGSSGNAPDSEQTQEFEDTGNFSVIRRSQPQTALVTPVVNNRTISQNLESMSSLSSYLQRQQHRVSSSSRRAISKSSTEEPSERLIR